MKPRRSPSSYARAKPSARASLRVPTAGSTKYHDELDALALTIYKISRQTRDDASKPGLRVATMHRVKGLEFDRVVVAGANADLLRLASALNRASDDAAREDAEHQERALFYVALTRARWEVLITSHGKPSTWLAPASRSK
jgi:superfamily I DNA/RNA helicase